MFCIHVSLICLGYPQRLTTAFRRKIRPTRIRHPKLHWAQSCLPERIPVLLNSRVHICHLDLHSYAFIVRPSSVTCNMLRQLLCNAKAKPLEFVIDSPAPCAQAETAVNYITPSTELASCLVVPLLHHLHHFLMGVQPGIGIANFTQSFFNLAGHPLVFLRP